MKAIDWALAVDAVNRPQSIEEWQARLLPEPATGPAPRSRAGDAAPGDPGPASGAAKNETFTRVKTTKTKAATAPSPAMAATTKAQTEAVAAPKTGFPLFALGGFLLIAGGIGATVTVLNNPGWLDGGSGGGGLAAAGKVAKPEGAKQAAAGSVGAPSTAPAPASKPATAEPVPPEAPKQAQSSPPPPPQPTAEGTKTEPPKQPQQVAIVTPQTAPVVPPPVSERWRTLGEGSLKIASSAISSDRTTIATGDQSGGVTVWSAETGRKIEGATIAAPSGNTAGHLAFASGPKGVLAFTSPRDSGPSFWTLGQTEPVPPAKSESGRWNVALVHSKAANAFVLVLVKAVPGAEGYQTVIERWTGKSDTPSGQDKADVDGLVNAAAISPGGDFLALASTNRKIAIWNIAAKEKTGSDIASDLDVRALAFSNQGLRLAAGGQNPESGQQNRIVLFGIKDPKAQKAIDIDGATVVGLAFSPDDRFLASGEIDGGAGRVSIWDLETRKLVGRRIEGATADPAILRSLSFGGGAAGAPLSVLVPWADGSLHNEPVCIASDSDCVAKISAAESRGKG